METTTFLEAFVSWTKVQSDVVGVALVGSYARDAATEESDVDLVILTVDVTKYFQSKEWLSLGIDLSFWALQLGSEEGQ